MPATDLERELETAETGGQAAAAPPYVYSVGFVCLCVCYPNEMSLDDVTELVNRQHPTGIQSRWEPSEDEMFADGVHTNPCPCHDSASRTHRLFNC